MRKWERALRAKSPENVSTVARSGGPLSSVPLCGQGGARVRLRFLGDSYDIVKQSLLRWLATSGAWAAQPMFTEEVTTESAEAFAQLLGVPLLSRDVLTQTTDRASYFRSAHSCAQHLFLDPDTGVTLHGVNGAKAPRYLFGSELVSIAEARPRFLTLVFDQSLPRGRELPELERKLSNLAAQGLHGVAYISHACFLLVGRDAGLTQAAFRHLREQSRLPGHRFLVKAGAA